MLADRCQSPLGTKTVQLLALSVTHEAVRWSSSVLDSPEIASITPSEQPLVAVVVVVVEDDAAGCVVTVVGDVPWPFGEVVDEVVDEDLKEIGTVVGETPELPQAAAVKASSTTVAAIAMARRKHRRTRSALSCSPGGTLAS